ncbi:MAG: efflux RND transporter periplasmic adaptor subunit [Gammaproteobacteria bacterium]|nr:efflux RND transporter periplasmic adaptor subunit [Gammaproteobacteria bacterium]
MLHARGRSRALSVLVLLFVSFLLVIVIQTLRPSAAADVALHNPLPLLPGATVRLESGFDLTRVFSGQLMSYQDSGLGFESTGIVDAVLVSEGDHVTAGRLLARLRRAELEAAVAEQVAMVAKAEATLDEVRAEERLAALVRERRLQLAVREVVAAEALEMAETDLAAKQARLAGAKAALLHAQASLERWQARLDQTELRAPHDGVVAALPARAGQALAAGAPAVRLVDLTRPHVHVGLPQAVAASLEIDADLTLVIDGERHRARLLALTPTVDAPARMVLAVLRPEGALSAARAGQLVRVEVIERKADTGTWLPLEALVEGRRGLWSGHFVRPKAGDTAVEAREGIVERRPLQVVHVGDGAAFVRGPFTEGDLYIRTALHRVVPGQRVRVKLD